MRESPRKLYSVSRRHHTSVTVAAHGREPDPIMQLLPLALDGNCMDCEMLVGGTAGGGIGQPRTSRGACALHGTGR